MAVITRYIIVRNGVELDKVFDDKRLADAYDKMLDAADSLAAFIKTGDLQIDLEDKTIEQIAVFLAKNGPEVTQILKGIKPVTAVKPKTSKSEDGDADEGMTSADKRPAAKPKSQTKK